MNDTQCHCFIEETLIKLFNKRATINFNIDKELRDKKLFGTEIRMPVRELVVLLYELEKDLNIKIPNQVILSREFDTFNNIYRVIQDL